LSSQRSILYHICPSLSTLFIKKVPGNFREFSGHRKRENRAQPRKGTDQQKYLSINLCNFKKISFAVLQYGRKYDIIIR